MKFSSSFEVGRSSNFPTQLGNSIKTSGRATPDSSEGELSEEARLQFYLEYWKHTVGVQMHFNDIEWRIRGLALTVVTFAFGAAGLAASTGITIGPISFGALILLIGAALWYAFYFVDSVWYHPMLKASVQQAEEIEKVLGQSLPAVGTTTRISRQSPQQSPWVVRLVRGKEYKFRSTSKLNYFYAIGFAVLIIGALALQAEQIIDLFAGSGGETPSN